MPPSAAQDERQREGSPGRRILSYARANGVPRTVKTGLRALGHALFEQTESTWFSRSLFDLPEEGAALFGDISFELEDAPRSPIPSWIEAHKDAFPWIYHPEELEAAYAEPHPYLAIRNGEQEIVGFVKLATGRVHIFDFRREVALPPGTGLIYDCLVTPACRGRRILGAAVTYLLTQMGQRSLHTVWAHIAHYNQSSRRAFERLGFVPRARIRYVRCHRYSLFIRDGRHPFANLAAFLEERSRP
jgi:RimJ/RimL family protein N-acetyltransferase